MRCDECTTLLLEADTASLRAMEAGEADRLKGIGLEASHDEGRWRDSISHVESCPACRAKITRILAGARAIDAALSVPPEAVPLDIDAILSRAALKADTRARPRRGVRAFTLLAAASLAVLLLMRRGDPPLPGSPLPTLAATYADFETTAGSNLAVLPTENPDITVLWFYE